MYIPTRSYLIKNDCTSIRVNNIINVYNLTIQGQHK